MPRPRRCWPRSNFRSRTNRDFKDAMAKKAVVNRDLKRRVTVKKYAKKRAELQATIGNMRLSDEDRLAARHKLQQLPRNASPTRLRNRCRLDRKSTRLNSSHSQIS